MNLKEMKRRMSDEQRRDVYRPISTARIAERSFGLGRATVILGGLASLFDNAVELIPSNVDINFHINVPTEIQRLLPVIPDIPVAINYGQSGVVAAALGALAMIASSRIERGAVNQKLAQKQLSQGAPS